MDSNISQKCQFSLSPKSESLEESVKSPENLLVICDTPTYTDGENFSMCIPINIFYEELSQYFNSVTFSSPTKKVNSDEFKTGYIIHKKKLLMAPRPFWAHAEDFFRKLPHVFVPTLITLNREIRRADIVLIRLPSPIGFPAWILSKLYRKKVIIHLRGTWEETVKMSKYFTNLRKAGALVAMYYFRTLRRFMMKRTPCFLHDSQILKEFKKTNPYCFKIAVSLISEKEIYKREDSCRANTIKLLFVGRLSPAKGIEYLIEGLENLPETIKLDIVGDGMFKECLQQKIRKKNLQGRVHFKGQTPFGEKLFREYKEANIFVIPSLTEGTPKCLFEAAAFGLPIIATRVGGIPEIIKHKKNGLLIEPQSSNDIRKAVISLLKNPSLRQKLIQGSHQIAQEFSLEKTATKYALYIYYIFTDQNGNLET